MYEDSSSLDRGPPHKARSNGGLEDPFCSHRLGSKRYEIGHLFNHLQHDNIKHKTIQYHAYAVSRFGLVKEPMYLGSWLPSSVTSSNIDSDEQRVELWASRRGQDELMLQCRSQLETVLVDKRGEGWGFLDCKELAKTLLCATHTHLCKGTTLSSWSPVESRTAGYWPDPPCSEPRVKNNTP